MVKYEGLRKKDERSVGSFDLSWSNTLFGPPRHSTMENKRSAAESNLSVLPVFGAPTYLNPLGPMFNKSALLKAQGGGNLFHTVYLIYCVYPLLYCWWIREQPVPCQGFFFSSGYQDTKFVFIEELSKSKIPKKQHRELHR